MPRKILPIYPHYFHVEFIAMKRNEGGITIRYGTTLASEDFLSNALLKFSKLKLSLIREFNFSLGAARTPFLREIITSDRFLYHLIDNVITVRIFRNLFKINLYQAALGTNLICWFPQLICFHLWNHLIH